MAEELYQNLVRSFDEKAPLSVHLSEWPEPELGRIDETLNREMALVMKLASIGHAARNKANRKVRQPLAEAAFSVANAEERRITAAYADLLKDELNVKAIRTLDTSTEAVSYTLNPLPRQLGQKYGGRFPALRQGILALPAEESARRLLAGDPVLLDLDGEKFEVLPEEVEVRAQAKSGYAVATEGAYLAALVTDLTPELEQEGLARELVRRIQDLRKQADLNIADRIRVFYTATPGLEKAVKAFAGYIQGETLALELVNGAAPQSSTQTEETFDGETVQLGLVYAVEA